MNTTITTGSLAQPNPGDVIDVLGPAEITGLDLDGVTINLAGDGAVIHGNTISGATFFSFTTSATNTQIIWNDFEQISNFCIQGYPGNDNTIANNKVTLLNVADRSTSLAELMSSQANGSEWLHLQAPCSGLNISNNVIIGDYVRWFIELQTGMTDLTVAGNWMQQINGPAISCATGGNTTPPYAAQGENIAIAGNIAICTGGPANTNCAVEIMGDKGVAVTGNFFEGYELGVMNGTGGQQNQPMTVSGNTFVNVPTIVGGDEVDWPIPAPIVTGNAVYATFASPTPAAPAMPTNVGRSFDPTTGGSTMTTPAPINLPVTLSSAGGGELTVSWTPPGVTAAPLVSIAPTNGAASMAVLASGLTPSSSAASFAGIPTGWKVTATVTYPGYQGSATMQVTGGPAPASNTSWPAAYVPPAAPPVVPVPTLTHTITVVTTVDGAIAQTDTTQVYSDGSIKTGE